MLLRLNLAAARRTLPKLASFSHRNVERVSARVKAFPFLEAISRGAGLRVSSSTAAARAPVDLTLARPLSLREASSTVVLPLSSDERLRDAYVSYLGDVRLGKVLEDCDAAAGGSAYEFVGHGRGIPIRGGDGPTPATLGASSFERGGVTIVTASVDQIIVHMRPSVACDLRYSSGVEWVGRSSMSVAVTVETRVPGSDGDDSGANDGDGGDDSGADNGARAPARWSRVLSSRFTMVALDEDTGRPVEVNKLAPHGVEEERRHAEASDAVQVQRMLNAELRAAADQPPSREELVLVHDLVRRHERGPITAGLRTIGSTRVESTTIMHPQHRNVHGKVFGGFLMRSAYESAYAASLFFTRASPQFLAVDDIRFIAPVDIGSVVRFTASVDHSEPPLFTVSVAADVIDPATGATVRTTTFYFTFTSPETQLVVPVTYSEALANVAARKILARSRPF
jgi:acyl-coenzyme A thioesterase 9